jgi:hypothetical protein
MKTTPQRTNLFSTERPTGIESVKFNDGMIVTAEDLAAAMRYPASMLHTVLHSYFGCGVVCGLELNVREAPGKQPNWVVCLDRGVAIDCHGYPIELCAPVDINLAPDECACEPPPEQVCIAIKRTTSDEAAPDVCGCDLDGPHFDCRRVRDHVLIRAFSQTEFDALPTACRRPAGDDPNGDLKDAGHSGDPTDGGKTGPRSGCQCLTACPDRACGDCWILLGCVTIYQDDNQGEGIEGKPDSSGRQWVKPIEFLCGPENPTVEELVDRLAKLEKLVEGLPAPPEPAPPPAPPSQGRRRPSSRSAH